MARPEAAAKRKADGGRQVSASFTAQEIELLEAAKKRGGFETNKEAMLAGLRAIAGQKAMSKDELLAEIGRRIK